MKIKVYNGCLVDNHNGIYTAQVFAERYPELVADKTDLEVLLSGPDNDEYLEVYTNLFPIETENRLIEQNESGDVLEYLFIDSDTITISQLNELARSVNDRGLSVIENQYGYAEIVKLGENCLCRVSLANVGIINADCFFEIDDFYSEDQNLQEFFEDIEAKLKEEFEEEHDIFTLPAFYAGYLINNDPSGLTNDEKNLIDIWLKENTRDICCGCSEESFFTWNHELSELGADECLEFYFRKVKP